MKITLKLNETLELTQAYLKKERETKMHAEANTKAINCEMEYLSKNIDKLRKQEIKSCLRETLSPLRYQILNNQYQKIVTSLLKADISTPEQEIEFEEDSAKLLAEELIKKINPKMREVQYIEEYEQKIKETWKDMPEQKRQQKLNELLREKTLKQIEISTMENIVDKLTKGLRGNCEEGE